MHGLAATVGSCTAKGSATTSSQQQRPDQPSLPQLPFKPVVAVQLQNGRARLRKVYLMCPEQPSQGRRCLQLQLHPRWL